MSRSREATSRSRSLQRTAGSTAASARSGTIDYNGLTLADLATVRYTAGYTQTGIDQHGGAPYLRVFTRDSMGLCGNNANDVVFTPNTQPVNTENSGRTENYDVLGETVRYNDDAGSFNQQGVPFRQVLYGIPGYVPTGNDNPAYATGHGAEVICTIEVSGGDGGAYSANTVEFIQSLTLEANGRYRKTFNFGNGA